MQCLQHEFHWCNRCIQRVQIRIHRMRSAPQWHHPRCFFPKQCAPKKDCTNPIQAKQAMLNPAALPLRKKVIIAQMRTSVQVPLLHYCGCDPDQTSKVGGWRPVFFWSALLGGFILRSRTTSAASIWHTDSQATRTGDMVSPGSDSYQNKSMTLVSSWVHHIATTRREMFRSGRHSTALSWSRKLMYASNGDSVFNKRWRGIPSCNQWENVLIIRKNDG